MYPLPKLVAPLPQKLRDVIMRNILDRIIDFFGDLFDHVKFWLEDYLSFIWWGGFIIVFFTAPFLFNKENTSQETEKYFKTEELKAFNKSHPDIRLFSRYCLIKELNMRIKHRIFLLGCLEQYSNNCTNTSRDYLKECFHSLHRDIRNSIAIYSSMVVYSNKVDDTRFYFSYPYLRNPNKDLPLKSVGSILFDLHYDDNFPEPVAKMIESHFSPENISSSFNTIINPKTGKEQFLDE